MALPREQRLWHVIVQDSGFIDAKERTEIADIFADGWTIKEMISLNSDGHVLLFMEKDRKAGPGGSGNMQLAS